MWPAPRPQPNQPTSNLRPLPLPCCGATTTARLQYNLLRFIATLIMALLFGTIYWGIGTNRSTMVDVMNIMGSLYTSALFLGIFNLLVVLPVVDADRAVFYRWAGGATGSERREQNTRVYVRCCVVVIVSHPGLPQPQDGALPAAAARPPPPGCDL